MNTDNNDNQHGPDAIERQLRMRLRDTSPDFEARFDALRRRLASEQKIPLWRRILGQNTRVRVGWGLAGSLALVLLVLQLRHPSEGALSAEQQAAFGDVILLDEALAPAQALLDGETLDALLLFTNENGGRS